MNVEGEERGIKDRGGGGWSGVGGAARRRYGKRKKSERKGLRGKKKGNRWRGEGRGGGVLSVRSLAGRVVTASRKEGWHGLRVAWT